MSTAAPPTAADLPDRDGVMAQAGAENFTVASALVGHATQRHLRAIYGFARLVDDVGDEATGDRSALLNVVSDRARAGLRRDPQPPGDGRAATDRVGVSSCPRGRLSA